MIYRGGAVLSQILSTGNDNVKISALVRSEKYAEKLRELGVEPILFRVLEDVEVIEKTARHHDSMEPTSLVCCHSNVSQL